MIPAASHAVPMEKPAELSQIIIELLTGDASPQTFMAVRRSLSTTTSES